MQVQTNKKNKYSDFWMSGLLKKQLNNADEKNLKIDESYKGLLHLAEIRRSISNFVTILTGKNIPVEFQTDDRSFTDGECVYISAIIHEGNFDSTVGIALHEASHILLSDFRLFKSLEYSISNDMLKKAATKNFDKPNVVSTLQQLLNWVEDRRIDHYIYKSAPGYKGYYKALYDRYFHSPIISKGLKSKEYRKEDLESYSYRLINITNPNTDLKALKGLQRISDVIDIHNIDRLETTNDALDVAEQIFDIMLDYIEPIDPTKQNSGSGDVKPGDGKPSSGGEKKKGKIVFDPNANGSGTPLDAKDLEKLSKKELKELMEAIEKQKDFLKGKIEKVKLSGNTLAKMNRLKDAHTDVVDVKVNEVTKQRRSYESVYDGSKYSVIVMKRVSREMFDSGMVPFSASYPVNQNAVNEGINLGKQLGKKLLIRNEERQTKYSRKEQGHIDKRLLSEVGFGNESIFSQTFTESYLDAILHMSIDISGSMQGSKLANAIKVVTSICQAASMMQGNLHIVVSLRGTECDVEGLPLVAIVYDSRVDKISKVKTLFPRIQVSGTTPEGLCFAAIQDLISASTAKLNSYFLNLSDGEPYYNYYSGDAAYKHTRGEVMKMRSKGVKVLSYFIDDGGGYHHDAFEQMYGSSSAYINPDSLLDITRTLNKLFLSKNN